MSLTANGGKAATSLTTQPSRETIIIRRGRLEQAPQIGRIAARTYFSDPITRFMHPRKEKYYADYERGFVQRSIARMLSLSTRNVTFVACTVEDPGRVVGYTQFVRLGDDFGAKNMVREVGVVKRVTLWGLSWLFWVYCLLLSWVLGGDKSVDKEATKRFGEWGKLDKEKHWLSQRGRIDGTCRAVSYLRSINEEGLAKG